MEIYNFLQLSWLVVQSQSTRSWLRFGSPHELDPTVLIISEFSTTPNRTKLNSNRHTDEMRELIFSINSPPQRFKSLDVRRRRHLQQVLLIGFVN
jgi:hypothetical protein